MFNVDVWAVLHEVTYLYIYKVLAENAKYHVKRVPAVWRILSFLEAFEKSEVKARIAV